MGLVAVYRHAGDDLGTSHTHSIDLHDASLMADLDVVQELPGNALTLDWSPLAQSIARLQY